MRRIVRGRRPPSAFGRGIGQAIGRGICRGICRAVDDHPPQPAPAAVTLAA